MQQNRLQGRRAFIASTAIGTLGALAARSPASQGPWESALRLDPPGTEAPPVRIAVVGVRGRGWEHVNAFARLPGVRVTALCDVDSEVLARRAAECATGDRNRTPFEVATTRDIRTLLSRDDIDAVSIATPNHTHAMLACWALEAGKHVYVEKPVSQVVDEGARIVEAANLAKRICATGTQARSSQAVRAAIAHIHAGGIGPVLCSRGLCYKPRKSIGKVDGPRFPPESVDYDRWLGPVAYQPLRRAQLHYDWHWDLATGNGDLGNQGIHQMDIARWALGWSEYPESTLSYGARLGYDDDGNSPNTQVVQHRIGDRVLVFEVRGLPRTKAEQTAEWRMDRLDGIDIGNIVYGEHGTVRISNSYTWAGHYDLAGELVTEWKGGGDHFANFVDAVRANDASLLNASINEGHLSSAYCHLGIVAHLRGEPSADETIESLDAIEPQFAEAVARMRIHLEANGIELRKVRLPLGRCNPRALDEAARELCVRRCRIPYVF
jgi:predicted dehydrogenase